MTAPTGPDRTGGNAAEAFDSEDVANTVRALADDMLAKFADDDEADVHGVYDWLVTQAAAIEAGAA